MFYLSNVPFERFVEQKISLWIDAMLIVPSNEYFCFSFLFLLLIFILLHVALSAELLYRVINVISLNKRYYGKALLLL